MRHITTVLVLVLALYGLVGRVPAAVDDGDVIGDTVTVGYTWYEHQHHGTIGKMIDKSEDGYLHFVWMNLLEYGTSERHVYYNFIDPSGVQGWPAEGVRISGGTRAGYTSLAVDPDGVPVPAFHQWTFLSAWEDYHVTAAPEIAPHSGTFLPVLTPAVFMWGFDNAVLFPRIEIDRSGVMHLLGRLVEPSGQGPDWVFYISGQYDPISYTVTYDPQWTFVDWTSSVAHDLATSDVSDRLAFGWMYCRDEDFPDPGSFFGDRNNDLYLMIDDDGQDLDFSQAFNLTQFYPPYLDYLPDTVRANMDTLRAFNDMSLMFDQDDWLHAAFTTVSRYELQDSSHANASIIWHWSEQYPGDFHIVANAFDPANQVPCTVYRTRVCRPSLGLDANTGYLYCVYQSFDVDPEHLSAGGYPSGEICVSVSTDGGLNWSEGTNITGTVTPGGAPPGESLAEIDPSLARRVDGDCHIQYIFDTDAGSAWADEGDWTDCRVIYHRVPVDSIATTPLVPQDVPFHIEHAPPVAVEPGEGIQPQTIRLLGAYPNPFNPTTVASFELRVASCVNLAVYDIQGRKVADLVDGWRDAGVHEVSFDGAGLASGMYFVRLTAGDLQQTQKIVLTK